MITVPKALDRRFQGSRDRGGARRRLVRRRRHTDRPAPPRRHRARALPDLVRSRVRTGRPRRSPGRSGCVSCAPRELDPVRRELDEYFEGRRRDFDLPLDLRGREGFARHPRASRESALRRGHDLQVAGGRGWQPRAARAQSGHEPATIPIVLPATASSGSRQPRRLRRRAGAEAAAPRPGGGNTET